MGSTSEAETGLRSDAQANYARILSAATRVIDREGPDAPLTTIAAEASVGIATLYRRFPTRGHLIEAVYRHRITTLCDSTAEILAAAPTPEAALETWMSRYMELLITNRAVPDAIRQVLLADPEFRNESKENLTSALESLLDTGRRTHQIRSDFDSGTVLRTLTGIGFVSETSDQTRQPLELVMAGLRA
ncbi:TetR/AcrR family transcriptional regulator [Gordonia sp. HY442]|uniref:TetR/AcrR family transcriptional regulator n=1 Tax=Gordonia zhenghanii TaxID=2911516 RepID=UPI001F461E28|nr:TetR/AcrR family transcriptional regulator [Gordonia zhenghanii]MCF8607573.1 TetR/AcrR family transcriptional regulator [Gordonia zhenghanii]